MRIKLGALAQSVWRESGLSWWTIPSSAARPARPIVNLLRAAGATEVHMRVSAPPFISPCYFGTDIPNKEKLIACHHTVDEICEIAGADSLEFLCYGKSLHKIAPGCPVRLLRRLLHRALPGGDPPEPSGSHRLLTESKPAVPISGTAGFLSVLVSCWFYGPTRCHTGQGWPGAD